MSAKVLMLLICYVGGPGTASQATPVVEKFLRHFEKAAGWAANSAQGAYRASLRQCQAAVDQHKPNLVVVDLPAYLSQHAKWKLRPLAHLGKANKKRYYLLVREGSFKSLADLKGKLLVSTLASNPRFLSKIIFGGKIDATKHFSLKRTRRPLKGIRKVARGRADATLVDETAFAHLAQLGALPAKLVSIHRSEGLPDLTLTTVTGHTSAKLTAQIKKALPKLCSGAGKQLCRTFQIDAFTKASSATFKKLHKRY